jgi:hypothetical protein
VRRFQIDWRRDTALERVFPTRDANAPAIARFQSGEAPFGMRCDQIVSIEHGKIEELSRDLNTDSVQSDIFRPGAAITVPIKSSHRIATAAAQLGSENVRGHERNSLLETMERKEVDDKIPFALILTETSCAIGRETAPGRPSNSLTSRPDSESRPFHVKKTIAIAYWLTPAEPERELFAEIIRVLATELDAPRFEPHLTICVMREETQSARETLKQIAAAPIRMRVRDVHCSNRFTKTLFVRFQRNRAFDDLTVSLRRAAKIPASVPGDPHLSLLYKNVSARAKEDLISAVRLPFSEVAFDSMSAVRCAVPVRDRADVEGWQTVATRSLRN